MDALLILDTETSGLDPKAATIVEVGAVLWSIAHGCILATYSDLVQAASNEAEPINRIPAASLPLGVPREQAIGRLGALVLRADAIVAHRAEFDSSFLPELSARTWVCSKFDIEWPHSKLGDPLVHVALAHGVPVTGAHRALTDCILLARVFEVVFAQGGAAKVRELLTRAMRPKVLVQALVTYDEREQAKAAGFAWDPPTKRWWRRMPVEEVPALPFRTRPMAEPGAAR
jgi:DNA polymerase-3 subunit epsilon